MGKYFGTDGIRGIVNKALTPMLAYKCAVACGYLIKQGNPNAKIIIGSDTRISKDMLLGAMISGFCYVGVDVVHIGVLPTPALAFLIDRMGADVGVMISASHNPYEYNGIKILAKGGIKLADEKENEIEALIDNFDIPPADKMGSLSYNHMAKDFYCEHIKQVCETDISGFRKYAVKNILNTKKSLAIMGFHTFFPTKNISAIRFIKKHLRQIIFRLKS